MQVNGVSLEGKGPPGAGPPLTNPSQLWVSRRKALPPSAVVGEGFFRGEGCQCGCAGHGGEGTLMYSTVLSSSVTDDPAVS